VERRRHQAQSRHLFPKCDQFKRRRQPPPTAAGRGSISNLSCFIVTVYLPALANSKADAVSASFVWLKLSVYEVESGRQPSLMKNSADDNAVSLRLIEDDVFTLLETADTRVNPITSPTQTRRVSKPLKTPG
jgi:hypothetical protein